MTGEEDGRNWNRPDAKRRPAERMNEADPGGKGQADFQDHLTKRADAGRGQREQAGRAQVLTTEEDVVRMSEQSADQSVLNELTEETDQTPSGTEDEITSPDVSLEHPHGPEGASHGGREPFQYVEDGTPTGTNAYSQTGGPPKKRKTGEG